MGVFHKMVPVVNRAPVHLSVRFDGQDMDLSPGPGQLPEIVIPFAKNQHPIMGSVDPYNPHMSGGQYLIGVVGEDDCEPLSEEEWEAHLQSPTRENHKTVFADKYGRDPKAKQVLLNSGKRSTGSSRMDAGTRPKGVAEFERDK